MLVATQGGGYYKGFTLIELLAIIIILAIIAVITVPIILNIINDAQKNASIDSAYGYKSALEKYYMKKVVENTENELPNGYKNISELPEDFTVSGESPSDGWVKLNKGIVEEYSLKYDEYVVTKFKDKDVKVSKRDNVSDIVQIPDEYQEVEYLEGTGTQYIDTGVFINSTTDIVDMQIAPTQGNADVSVFGYYGYEDTCEFGLLANKFRSNVKATSGSTYNVNQKYNINYSSGNWSVDGTQITNGNSSSTGIKSAYLFARNYNASLKQSPVRVYSLKIKRNNEIIRNLVPVARKSDNKPGMLDMANLSKNLFDENYENISANLVYKPIYVGDGTFTLSTDIPNSSNKHLFLIGGNVNSGASSGTNGVSITISRTVEAIDGYVTIVYRSSDYTSDPRDCHTMLNKGSTALPYEPYKKSFYTNEGTGEFTAGPEL